MMDLPPSGRLVLRLPPEVARAIQQSAHHNMRPPKRELFRLLVDRLKDEGHLDKDWLP